MGQMTGLVMAFANERWHIGGVLPIVSFFVAVLSYALGLGPIPWILTPELFPDEVRPLACSLTTGFNWLLSAGIIFIWPVMKNEIGMACSFFLFACCCLMSIFYGFVLMPETKDDEIGKLKAGMTEKDVEKELISDSGQDDRDVSSDGVMNS
jgi:hypothetical protein